MEIENKQTSESAHQIGSVNQIQEPSSFLSGPVNKNSATRLVGLIIFVFFGFLGFLIFLGIMFVFATDGLDNLRGVPETGWGAMIALIVGVPIASVLYAISWFGYNLYKKNNK